MTLRLEKLPLKILLSSVLLMTGVIKADDERPGLPTAEAPRTENSYLKYKDSKTGFCGETSSSAESLIKNLAEKNQNSFDRMESIKEKINADIAAITILQETQRAKTEYLAKIKEMSDKTTKRTAAAAIENSKEVFSKAMMLSSLSVIMQDKNNLSPTASLKTKVCALEKFKKSAMCSLTTFKNNSREERSYYYLDEALSKLSGAKAETIRAKTQEIINSIPKEFSPDIMIALLETKPELKKVLDSDSTAPLIKCMNNSSDQDCVKFFGDKNASKKLVNAVLDQSSQVGTYLHSHAENINQIVAQNKIEIDKDHQLLSAINDDSVIDLKNLSDKCIADINARLKNSSKEHLDKLSSHCKASDKDQFLHAAQSNIKSLSIEMNSIRGNENFNMVESFKSYLANKYLCMCPQANKIKIESATSCYRLEGVEAPSTVYTLGGTVSEIIRNINYADKIANECRPGEQKMKELHERCKKVSDQNDFKSVCTIVSSENQKQQKTIAENKAWKAENDKFWIKRDPSAKGGYTKTPKKTTMELLGEGMAPAIPTLVPMWFANYQMSNHIDMLTQQALAEKQYYHTVGMYNQNPWMYGAPYFQGNYLPMGNFGATGTSTTTASGGYNFSAP